jgi:hypothetical protein
LDANSLPFQPAVSLAEILFGDVNPSGKLPFAFEKRFEDNRAYPNYPAVDASGAVTPYKEGIFVGYRGFVERPIRELKGFKRVYLQPAESRSNPHATVSREGRPRSSHWWNRPESPWSVSTVEKRRQLIWKLSLGRLLHFFQRLLFYRSISADTAHHERTPMGNTDILSIQLYTLRSLGELDRVLDTVKQAGYGHVETVGSQLDDAENVRTKLDARGLKVSSSHVSLAALRERPDVVVRACRTLGP